MDEAGKKDKKKPDINECATKRLSRKEQSAKELRDYLLKREYEKEEVDRVIDTMKDFGYLDDRRFAFSFLMYDFERGRSRSKAFFELRQKGVSEEDIEAAYNEYLDEYGEPDEHELAYQEAMKVLRQAELEPGKIPDEIRQKINGRIARRLFARGFSQSLIYEIINEL